MDGYMFMHEDEDVMANNYDIFEAQAYKMILGLYPFPKIDKRVAEHAELRHCHKRTQTRFLLRLIGPGGADGA